MVTYNQLSLADVFADCQEICDSDKPAFLSLLEKHIDLDEIIPASFRTYNQSLNILWMSLNRYARKLMPSKPI